jgi:hypothetical protein
MATKVTTAQILDLKPSQLQMEGAQEGDTLVARRTVPNGGLTLTWSPTSILPKTALHGQVLTYNFYTAQWMASSISIGGGSSIPTGNSNQINQVLTWNGVAWVIAPPQGTVTSVRIANTDGALTIGSPNTITTTGTINIDLNTVPLNKIARGAASSNQVLTWNASTAQWSPSAVSNSVGDIRAVLLFDGRAEPVNAGILASKNITSITDNGVGDYTINFTSNAFSNDRYSYSYGLNKNVAGKFTGQVVEVSRSATSMRIHTGFIYSKTLFEFFDTNNISLVFVV